MNVAAIVGGVPTALAAALVIPPSVFTAFRSKNNTKLIASTQVHAFNGEESTARIGQRVPVQTAQAYPFGVQTGHRHPDQTEAFPSGGFPVINYEPTGSDLEVYAAGVSQSGRAGEDVDRIEGRAGRQHADADLH